MYKILGADGKEYGPASVEQIRQWIAEGRANGQTKAQAEASAEWKTLGELAEFADALRAKAPPPAAPPLTSRVHAEQMANEIIARDFDIDISACLSRGWSLVTDRFWLCVGVTVLFWLARFVAGMVPFGLFVLWGVLLGGYQWMFLKRARGHEISAPDAFAGFTLAFVPLMLAGIVSKLLFIPAFLLCILPFIYLYVAWKFAFLLAIDKKMDFWPALEVSRKVITRHWWTMFGFLIVLWFINLIGTLLCGIGLLVTWPVTAAALVYAYEDIFRVRPVESAPPAVAPAT
ncbi:MAG: DUF4339 domain-containing protein [Verrucomicrobia bacterium]|nr:DUF4339 domain-containing protein [Verrucomicrobiota bacterium]